ESISLAAPSTVTAAYTITFPADAPGANTVLTYDGADYIWSSNGSGDINDGGNSFGADISIGTNDAFSLFFKTNNINRIYIPSGNTALIAVDSNTLQHFNITAGNAVSGDNDGGDLIL